MVLKAAVVAVAVAQSLPLSAILCGVCFCQCSGGGVARMRRKEEQDQEFRIVDTPDTSTPAPRSELQHTPSPLPRHMQRR